MRFWDEVLLFIGSFGLVLPIVIFLLLMWSVVFDGNLMFSLLRNGLYYYLIIGVSLILAIPIYYIKKLF